MSGFQGIEGWVTAKCDKFGTTGKSIRFSGIVSSPGMKNILLYSSSDLRYTSGHPVPPEGRIMIVTTRWRGWRWTLRRQVLAPDENAAAYGEVVWSWRRDPGVKPRGKSHAVTVAKQAAHRGEHEISRNTIARGKSGCLGCTCQTRVRSFYHCTRQCGRSRRPAFPAPSSQEEGQRDCKTRTTHAAGTRVVVPDVAANIAVVPAKAGTHSPRRKLFQTRWSSALPQQQPV